MKLFSTGKALSEKAIKKHLKVKHNILCYSSLSSTQDTLKELTKEGAEEGCIVTADFQSGGRGREGRSFFSPHGSGIYMSILLRPAVSAPTLSPKKLVHITTSAAVAVCEAVESVTGRKTEIKWVNDVFCNGLKISGILTEAVFNANGTGYEHVILGIGVNLYENSFPSDIKAIAGAIYGKKPLFLSSVKARLTSEIINRFDHYYGKIKEEDFSFTEKYKSRSLVIGKSVDIYVGDVKTDSGKVISLTDDCALNVVKDSGETVTLSYGEVRIRLNEKQ